MTIQQRTANRVNCIQPILVLLLGLLLCLFSVQPLSASSLQDAPEPGSVASRPADDDLVESPVTEDETRNVQTRKRLILTAISCFGVISLLSLMFVYLRLNHATRGFYSRRLQVGAGFIAVIVLMACIGLILILK